MRVLDLTRLLPGAFATLMLAELGADVIKIEDPNGGDPLRALPPLVDGESLYHHLLDRGKRSVALDLRLPASAAALDKLLASTDVLVESFRPKAARRLGVSAEQIRARHPRIIHCSITGYGQTGPYADRPGHDLNYVAESGFLAADRPGVTSLPRMFIADVGGGAMSAAVGILAHLFARERTGEGAAIDISMHEAALYWVMVPAAGQLLDDPSRATGELPTYGSHACYNVYRTKDDLQIALGALEEKFWRGFADAVGRPHLTARHLTGPDDQAALRAEVSAIFATRTRDEWITFFEGRDVCLSPVLSAREALADPHVVARGVVSSVSGMRVVRPPFVSATRELRPAPAIGAHTDEVLR